MRVKQVAQIGGRSDRSLARPGGCAHRTRPAHAPRSRAPRSRAPGGGGEDFEGRQGGTAEWSPPIRVPERVRVSDVK